MRGSERQPGCVQFSSDACSFVMAAVSLRRSPTRRSGSLGQICSLRRSKGQAGTAFALGAGEREPERNQLFFRRTKSLMGLDIGSSAVKAIELKPSGKGYKVTAIGVEPIPPDSIVDGAIIDGGAVADAVRRLFENKQFSAKEVGGVPVRQLGHRQEDHAADHDRAGTGGVDLLGSRAVHPVRHPGRQSRLRDPVARRRAGHHGRPAGGGEEGQDRRLHQRHHPGRPHRGGRGRGRLRAAERLRGQLRLRARRGGRPAERRRQRHQHQHPERIAVGLHPRHLDGRQCLHRGRAAGTRAAVRARRAAEEGRGRRGRHL